MRTALLAAALVLASCADGSRATAPPDDPVVRIGAATDSVLIGSVSRVARPAVPARALASDTIARWHSSDTMVAIVDSTGEVFAVASGQVTITAQYASWRAEHALRVALLDPAPALRFESGSTGFGQVCGIVDGRVYCADHGVTGWFFKRPPQSFLPMPGAAGRRFTKVATSLHATCALADDGRIFCWRGVTGQTRPILWGRLYTHSIPPTDTGPVPVSTSLRFRDFDHGGHSTTCGVERDEGVLHCWGNYSDRTLLTGDIGLNDTVPRPVVGEHVAQSVDAGNFRTCFVDDAGRAYCGGTSPAAFGASTPVASDSVRLPMPVAQALRFTTIATDDMSVCGIATDARLLCWGGSIYGGLGDGSRPGAPPRAEPRPVVGDLRVRALAMSFWGPSCALTVEGAYYCWGRHFLEGRAVADLADRLGDRAYRPQPIATDMTFRSLAGASCAITHEGRMRCF